MQFLFGVLVSAGVCVTRNPVCLFFLYGSATTEIYTYGHTLSLHDALPISARGYVSGGDLDRVLNQVHVSVVRLPTGDGHAVVVVGKVHPDVEQIGRAHV